MNPSHYGHLFICLAWVLALTAMLSGLYSGWKRDAAWLGTTRNATLLTALLCLAALILLGWIFYQSDFRNLYVWQFSNREMHPVYRITAIWGGMDGSMLLWCTMLALSAGMIAWRTYHYPRSLAPWTLAVLNSASLFFLTIVVRYSNPFRMLDAIAAPYIPPDGNGLNPLLQNPYMAAHPPILYAGFTMLSVPYAFCLAALLSGNLGNDWIRLTRQWTLFGWGLLTAGIMLGGHWAYLELGWGGFWAWDPVENASFLPWLSATAFLHSVLVQERKQMLKFWNIWLVILTYSLTIFGTFLTRSGIVQSVHAFASTDIGIVFLQYLGLVLSAAALLTFYRRKELKSERQIESFFSREAAFLLNNLLLLSICFATIWGVLFPVISEAVTGQKHNVGVPFFNAVNVPLFLALLFLMAIGPLIAWRKASLAGLKKSLILPLLLSLVLVIVLALGGIEEFYALTCYGLCFLVLLSVLGELHKGLRVSGSRDLPITGRLSHLFKRHRLRYGGYLVHVGVAISAISISASMAHKFEKEFTLGVGESITLRRFELRLADVKSESNKNYDALIASLVLLRARDKKELAKLQPEKRIYLIRQEPTSEVSIRSSLLEDFYVTLAGTDNQLQRVVFKVFINPLQVWLWFGGLIILLGTVFVAWPKQVVRTVQLNKFATG